jgi:hypothetical protein
MFDFQWCSPPFRGAGYEVASLSWFFLGQVGGSAGNPEGLRGQKRTEKSYSVAELLLFGSPDPKKFRKQRKKVILLFIKLKMSNKNGQPISGTHKTKV